MSVGGRSDVVRAGRVRLLILIRHEPPCLAALLEGEEFLHAIGKPTLLHHHVVWVVRLSVSYVGDFAAWHFGAEGYPLRGIDGALDVSVVALEVGCAVAQRLGDALLLEQTVGTEVGIEGQEVGQFTRVEVLSAYGCEYPFAAAPFEVVHLHRERVE